MQFDPLLNCQTRRVESILIEVDSEAYRSEVDPIV
jgi:hypothetical protein